MQRYLEKCKDFHLQKYTHKHCSCMVSHHNRYSKCFFFSISNDPFVIRLFFSQLRMSSNWTVIMRISYLRICAMINCDVCLQASTQARRTLRTFSRSSGQSFDWPMCMSKSLKKATWLLISTISYRREGVKINTKKTLELWR